MTAATLSRLTFDKAKQAFADERVFVVPVGSTEPHGNYTPWAITA